MVAVRQSNKRQNKSSKENTYTINFVTDQRGHRPKRKTEEKWCHNFQ